MSQPHNLIYGVDTRRPGPPPPDLLKVLNLGHHTIDTSSNDPQGEIDAGTALAGAQDAPPPSVQAKYSPPALFPGPAAPPYDPAADSIPLQILKSVETTLHHLGGGARTIDTYFLHRPLPQLADTLRAWEVLEEVARRGGARRLGVSQVNLATLRLLHERADVKPSVVQNHFSPGSSSSSNGGDGGRHYDRDVRLFCRDCGIEYQAFGVQQQQQQPAMLELVRRSGTLDRLPDRLRESERASAVALVLVAARRNGERFFVLDGSRDVQHIRENVQAATYAANLEQRELDVILERMPTEFLL